MRKTLSFFMVLLFALNLHVSAAMFSTSPAMLQANSKNVKIIFDASQSGVAAIKNASALYAHIGVTLKSDPGKWAYVIGDWSSNTDNKKFTKNSNGLWELNIGDIKTYFGVSDPSEVAKIAVIARTTDGKSQTGDNFIDVYGDGFQMMLTADSPLVINSNRTITFTVATTENASLTLSIDGKTVKTADNTTTISASQTFGTSGAFNTVKATASNGATTLSKELTVAYPGESPVKAYPGGTPKQGAVRNADGTVTFCLAAPQKKSVMLIGEWDGYAPKAHSLMNRQDVDGVSYFWATTPAPLAEHEYHRYYYLVDTTTPVADPYARLVLDPWNDKSIPQGCFDDMPQYPYDIFSDKMLAVYRSDIDDYNWDDATLNFEAPDRRGLNIYEVLLRDFTGDGSDSDGKHFGTFRSAKQKIGYLRDLGINAVELMPVMEFNGNNSWGYNPNFYMTVDKTYGSPKDMRDFVAECHRNGIAVILDIVFNQSDGLHPWYQMYASGSSPFYNKVAPHSYSVLNDWNQDYKPVTDHWADVLTYWLEAYKVDGFRFDLVKGLGDNTSYANSSDSGTNAYNASRVARMKRLHDAMREVNPDAYFINENLAGAKEENEMAADGELNWANVNDAGCEYAMGYSSKASLNRMWAVRDSRTAGSTVAYLESHDEQRLAYKQDQWGAAGIKGNHKVSMQRLGAAAAQMILVPGSHMIWQFSEMGNAQNTKDATGGNNTSPKIVCWDLLEDPDNAGLVKSYSEMIGLRLSHPDLFAETADYTFNLGSWATGRYIKARTADKELYVVINPNPGKSIDMEIDFRSDNNSAYYVASKSFDSEPAFDAAAKKVTVEANCYAVIATNNLSGVEGIVSDALEATRIFAVTGGIRVVNCDGPVNVYTPDGVNVASGSGDSDITVDAGTYVVRAAGKTAKVVVR